MTRRFGVALEGDGWRWAIVELHGERVSVLRTGRVEPNEWALLVAQARETGSIGIALPDDQVMVRRIRVGHPPGSSESLRNLARWRLNEDLAFASVALDARMDGDHAVVLAADRARVDRVESDATACGPVERVTSVGLAVLGLLSRPSDGTVTVNGLGSHIRARFGAGTLESIQLFKGAPSDAVEKETRVELSADDTLPSFLDWSDDIPRDGRGRSLPAIGAVLDGFHLNLATRPPIPKAALWLSWAIAGIAGVAAAVSVAFALHASQQLRVERHALASLPEPVPYMAPAPRPELAALGALSDQPSTTWTSFFASLERTLPPGVTLDRVEWKDRGLRLVVAADKAEQLEEARLALTAIGSVRSLSQGGTDMAVRAEFDVELRP